jgi:hypothetical protein
LLTPEVLVVKPLIWPRYSGARTNRYCCTKWIVLWIV